MKKKSTGLKDVNFKEETNWQKLMNSLSEEQKENIKAKCRWEAMSWLGVLKEWPSLFENESNKDLVENEIKSLTPQ